MGRHGDPDDIGTGYVEMLAAGPLHGVAVRNVGIGGDRVHLVSRWDRDVLSVPADLVSIHIGIDDTWRRNDHGEAVHVTDFTNNLPGPARPLRIALMLVELFVIPVSPTSSGGSRT